MFSWLVRCMVRGGGFSIRQIHAVEANSKYNTNLLVVRKGRSSNVQHHIHSPEVLMQGKLGFGGQILIRRNRIQPYLLLTPGQALECACKVKRKGARIRCLPDDRGGPSWRAPCHLWLCTDRIIPCAVLKLDVSGLQRSVHMCLHVL